MKRSDWIGDLLFGIVVSGIVTALVTLLFSSFKAYSKQSAPIETVHLTATNYSFLQGRISADNIYDLMIDVQNKLESLPVNEPFYLVMDTGGGDLLLTMRFLDFCKGLSREIKTVSLLSNSAGFQIVQELGERLVTERGQLSNHRYISNNLSGSIPGSLESAFNISKNLFKSLHLKNAIRMGISYETYYEKIRDDSYITIGQEAIDENTADRVVRVHCDLQLLFSGDCPLTKRMVAP